MSFQNQYRTQPEVQFTRANIFIAQRKFDKSKSILTALLKNGADSPGARINLAICHHMFGDHLDTIETLMTLYIYR
jgi:hypothetical protein